MTTVGLWSDTLDRTSRWRYEGASFASAFDVVDCAWTVIDSGPGKAGMLSLHRQERDFTERDRLSSARCARTFRRSSGTLTPGAVSPISWPPSIQSTRASRRAFSCSTVATRSTTHRPPPGICSHAGSTGDSRLPTAVGDWLRSDARREPLVVEAAGQRLVVVAPTRGGLVLTEQVAPPATLTSRARGSPLHRCRLLDRRNRALALGHAGDGEQAPRAHLPQARGQQPHGRRRRRRHRSPLASVATVALGVARGEGFAPPAGTGEGWTGSRHHPRHRGTDASSFGQGRHGRSPPSTNDPG